MAKAPPAPAPAHEQKTLPVATFRIGLVKASVWKNGTDKPHYNTTFSRSYKDREGNWKDDGDSYGHSDLLSLAKVAERAEEFIANQD